jgi:hypothetical protein
MLVYYSIILDEIASLMMHRLVEIMLVYMHSRREMLRYAYNARRDLV